MLGKAIQEQVMSGKYRHAVTLTGSVEEADCICIIGYQSTLDQVKMYIKECEEHQKNNIILVTPKLPENCSRTCFPSLFEYLEMEMVLKRSTLYGHLILRIDLLQQELACLSEQFLQQSMVSLPLDDSPIYPVDVKDVASCVITIFACNSMLDLQPCYRSSTITLSGPPLTGDALAQIFSGLFDVQVKFHSNSMNETKLLLKRANCFSLEMLERFSVLNGKSVCWVKKILGCEPRSFSINAS